MTFGDLPAINACLNGASALFLGAGYVLIRQGRWRAHRGFMLAAFVTSTLFLLFHVTCVRRIVEQATRSVQMKHWLLPVLMLPVPSNPLAQ